MGFSVSGSFAILVVAAFIALGMFYPAVTNGIEQVDSANNDAHDGSLTKQNTAITITRAEYVVRGVNSFLVIEVENRGTTELSVNGTDILVDDAYVMHAEIEDSAGSSEDVDGDDSTDLWLPGETYNIEIGQTLLDQILDGTDVTPSRVKIVSGPGVSDSQEVS